MENNTKFQGQTTYKSVAVSFVDHIVGIILVPGGQASTVKGNMPGVAKIVAFKVNGKAQLVSVTVKLSRYYVRKSKIKVFRQQNTLLEKFKKLKEGKVKLFPIRKVRLSVQVSGGIVIIARITNRNSSVCLFSRIVVCLSSFHNFVVKKLEGSQVRMSPKLPYQKTLDRFANNQN